MLDVFVRARDARFFESLVSTTIKGRGHFSWAKRDKQGIKPSASSKPFEFYQIEQTP
jgi:hypothetical protein